MTDSNDKNETKSGAGRAGGGTLTLKRPTTEQSRVKQSFSHGRTKTVVVETKRKRFGDDKPAEAKPMFQVQPKVAAPATPPRTTQNNRSGVVLRTLTDEEKEARDRALVGSRVREAEERKQQEIEALRRQDRQTFESLNRMKNEFIRMATHDLRNPLNVILGYRSVLQRLTVAEEHQALMDEALQAIDDNVEKMRKLVTDMLDLAQMETSWQFKPAPVSLTGLLEKAVGNFHLIAEQKGITLALAPPTGDTTVIVDASAITRVVDNLIVNALKYTPPGERIAVRAKLRGQHAIIQVGDTGIGIPPEDVPHVFDAFYRVKRPDVPDVEGTGLGLSIVLSLIHISEPTRPY